ncbi:phosphatidylserine decarboxylase proenzyme, mitochondrial [Chelonus insularis]|uniref:phosphatidylserine decarboxylase proenzyme, mitochondrial n=1 Tax=Chelonus insularis TaxID=460826 RepID=UPI00158F5387|nr:phosphatidylserine decarboxylase proenzyme, mitochondrial [Chelonus insularis]XP_034935742.1 phosphatidylserine decarboxylase proenzyme, mitochondrial [Chelonus insularis]XP_034935743.1 phosphatidylserine decarboxylase proenzyme, mitochondrial [Chelonus insularis]XP_034935744.1 phosphatidylserine decarboxylase proenzyme, mitochondrial [Chelonus insularis]XP_034935745.1 phosphatidylserine decarboxylase proenzyme, mitochondrial [Chelonus insularis]
MSFFRIPNFSRHVRPTGRGSWQATSVKITQWIYFRRYSYEAEGIKKSRGLWSFTKKWTISLPIGIGVSLITILQLKYFWGHHSSTNGEVKRPINNLMVECYCCLPLRITSRIFGWFASVELPQSFRPFVYNLYAKTFHANLQEIDCDLKSFPSLVDFFVRPLKHDARPIAQNTNLVSPVDGTVLYFGPVNSCRVEQVKGVTYNLRHFLGDAKSSTLSSKTEFCNEENDSYLKSLLKNSKNKLYQLTIYLAPGDYHRFHSAADWKINFRRHFQGKLLSVNPKIASWLPDLFAINERVVYLGEWTGGFMAYAAVGATNVGSIRVFCDDNLVTNKKKWPKDKLWEDTMFEYMKIKKGQLFGEFRMGSTIVLLFEAPENLKLCIAQGQSIRMGQALTERPISHYSTTFNHLNECALEATKLINIGVYN